MMIMLLGASIYATFFSYFVVMIYNRNAKTIENNKKLEQALGFAEQLNLKSSLKSKIKFYYSTIRLQYDDILRKNQLMQELPSSLKRQISLKVYSEFIKKVSLFSFTEDSFVKDLCS